MLFITKVLTKYLSEKVIYFQGEKTQPKQVWQESPAPIATRVSTAAQPTAEASPYKPCADSCTPLAASQTMAFNLLHHFAHSAIVARHFFEIQTTYPFIK